MRNLQTTMYCTPRAAGEYFCLPADFFLHRTWEGPWTCRAPWYPTLSSQYPVGLDTNIMACQLPCAGESYNLSIYRTAVCAHEPRELLWSHIRHAWRRYVTCWLVGHLIGEFYSEVLCLLRKLQRTERKFSSITWFHGSNFQLPSLETAIRRLPINPAKADGFDRPPLDRPCISRRISTRDHPGDYIVLYTLIGGAISNFHHIRLFRSLAPSLDPSLGSGARTDGFKS